MIRLLPPQRRRRWEAGSGAVFPLDSNARRPEGWTSADAAGLEILPGLVRYDEVFGSDGADTLIATGVDDVLHEDQVLSVECVWAEDGKPYAVKLEEMIRVRDGEPEVIGSIPVDARLLA